jgi:hypothetical protein
MERILVRSGCTSVVHRLVDFTELRVLSDSRSDVRELLKERRILLLYGSNGWNLGLVVILLSLRRFLLVVVFVDVRVVLGLFLLLWRLLLVLFLGRLFFVVILLYFRIGVVLLTLSRLFLFAVFFLVVLSIAVFVVTSQSIEVCVRRRRNFGKSLDVASATTSFGVKQEREQMCYAKHRCS